MTAITDLPIVFFKAANGRVKCTVIAFIKSQGRPNKQNWNKVLQQYWTALII